MNLMPKELLVSGASGDLCSQPATGEVRSTDRAVREIVWQVPEEVPVAFQFNSEPFTVMMATPADLRDFAVGFSLAERLVRSKDDIKGVLVMPVENGIAIDIAVADGGLDETRFVRRSIEGRTGCGLCGVEDIAGAIKPVRRLDRSTAPSTAAVLKAANDLPGHQPMNQFNRTVHGAAWVAPDGTISLVREDVGRHNALDKLIGALSLAGTDVTQGFVLMTSRCSYELVQKSASAGITALVTVSAPTTLALELARKSNLFLAALGAGGIVVFNP